MTISIEDYEKLGAFYLGHERSETDATGASPVLYDSKDLLTHGVVLGMTGSGKTGLCLALIEEAAIDRIPAILIDPKGDLPNLMLTFPALRAEDFRPWIDEADAERRGLTPDQLAEAQASLWRKGLAESGQDGERIRKLREAVDLAIYTPGSRAGIPVSILTSLAAPPFEVVDDGELLAERIESTVSSLLSLLGVDRDPLKSREHVFLSALFAARWLKGEDVTLPGLIADVQAPPIGKIGVLDVDAFIDDKSRATLAMSINGLLAAPGFQTWLTGVPLDVPSFLFGPNGKPRVSIFSIAHLGEPERMFFVTLLLHQVIAWMRTQSGTTSLRALLYMDEVYGYLPPIENPSAKKPMLTLLKQARAFGVGVLLATQNPVDLDYKALSNAGTWWLGRLQTERDKARVLEGLEGSNAFQGRDLDRGRMEQLLAGLEQRVFLMNDVHEDRPVVFKVRFCLSYLRGPLTRTQIKTLMDPLRDGPLAASPGRAAPAVPPPGASPASASRPTLPDSVPEYFAPVRAQSPDRLPVVLVPHLVRAADIRFSDPKKGIAGTRKLLLLDELRRDQSGVDAGRTRRIDGAGIDGFRREPDPGVSEFGAVPAFALQKKAMAAMRKELLEHCVSNEGTEVLHATELDRWSNPGEPEAAFRLRLLQAAREARDAAVERLRAASAKKARAIEERLRRAEASVEREKQQSRDAWMGAAVSVSTGVLGALLGRKRLGVGTISRGASAARAAGRAAGRQGDVGRAEETVKAVRRQLDEIESELTAAIARLQSTLDPERTALVSHRLEPRKKDVAVTAVGVLWLPFFRLPEGSLRPAFDGP